jgi:hypothetical protein
MDDQRTNRAGWKNAIDALLILCAVAVTLWFGYRIYKLTGSWWSTIPVFAGLAFGVPKWIRDLKRKNSFPTT